MNTINPTITEVRVHMSAQNPGGSSSLILMSENKEERVLCEEVSYLILDVERLNCELASTRERGRQEGRGPGRAFLNYFILSLSPYISLILTLLWSYIIIKYIIYGCIFG